MTGMADISDRLRDVVGVDTSEVTDFVRGRGALALTAAAVILTVAFVVALVSGAFP